MLRSFSKQSKRIKRIKSGGWEFPGRVSHHNGCNFIAIARAVALFMGLGTFRSFAKQSKRIKKSNALSQGSSSGWPHDLTLDIINVTR
jgi:hypothetical protein